MHLLSRSDIIFFHESVIEKNELQGFAGDKSLDAILGRVDQRVQYGIITDLYDLAATYAVVIAVGHIFNDANKRTAFSAMDTCLRINGVILNYNSEEIGQTIIQAAQGQIDEIELARYLRNSIS